MPTTRKYTEAQKQSAKKWDAANFDRLSIALPKGRKETVQSHAAARGESVNGFIGRAIGETMERDNGDGKNAVGVSKTDAPAQTLTEAKRMVRAAGDVISPSLLRESVAEASKAAGETDDAFLWRAVSGQAEQDREKRKAAANAADAPKGILISVVVSLSLDELERVQATAEAAGEGVTDFIRHTIEARSRDGAKGRRRK